jgi:hypothetical protein
MGLAGHVERTGEGKDTYRGLVNNLTKREHWKVLGVDRLIILKWIVNKHDGGVY